MPSFVVFLIQYHPQGKERHDGAMSQIPKHHSKQEGKCDESEGCCGQKAFLFILFFLNYTIIKYTKLTEMQGCNLQYIQYNFLTGLDHLDLLLYH